MTSQVTVLENGLRVVSNHMPHVDWRRTTPRNGTPTASRFIREMRDGWDTS